MATITEAIATGRQRIIAFEPQMVGQLDAQYLVAWRAIERFLDDIERHIEAAQAAGVEVDEAWLRAQTWYRQMQESIRIQLERFQQGMTATLATTQATAVAIAGQASAEIRRSLGEAFAGRVNAGGFERWVTAQQPRSPLARVIRRYGDRGGETITRLITEGVGKGYGTRQISRAIRRELRPDGMHGRIETLVRTELMRAYRGSQRDDLEQLVGDDQSGWEWEWLAARSTRTCAACLAMDGQRFPYGEYPDRFHVSCRCVVRLVPPASVVPPRGRERMTGEVWLRNQPADIQRRVMRTPAAYEAFSEGEPLINFVGIRHNEEWGDAIYVRTAAEVCHSRPVALQARKGRAA